MDRPLATPPDLRVRTRLHLCWAHREKRRCMRSAAPSFQRPLKFSEPVSAARSRSASPRIPRPRPSDAVGSDSSQAQTRNAEQEEHRAGRGELQSGQRRIHRPGHDHKPIEPRGEEHQPEAEKKSTHCAPSTTTCWPEFPQMSGALAHGGKPWRRDQVPPSHRGQIRDAARQSPGRTRRARPGVWPPARLSSAIAMAIRPRDRCSRARQTRGIGRIVIGRHYGPPRLRRSAHTSSSECHQFHPRSIRLAPSGVRHSMQTDFLGNPIVLLEEHQCALGRRRAGKFW